MNKHRLLKWAVTAILICILVVFFVYSRKNTVHKENKRDNIVVLIERGRENLSGFSEKIEGDISERRIEMIKFFNPQSESPHFTVLTPIPFRYTGIEKSIHYCNRLRPMIYNKNTDTYYFLNYLGHVSDDTSPSWMKLDFDRFLSGKHQENRMYIGITDFPYIASVSDKADILITSQANFLNSDNGDSQYFEDDSYWNFTDFGNLKQKNDISDFPDGAVLVNDNTLVVQYLKYIDKTEYTIRPRSKVKSIHPNKPVATNYLLMLDSSARQFKKIESGFFDPGHPINPQLFLPMDYSPDQKKVAFLSLQPLHNKELDFCLTLWDFEKNKIEKRFFLPDEIDLPEYFNFFITNTFIVWSPSPENRYIVLGTDVFLIVYSLDTGKAVYSRKTKKMLSVRWSKDGKYLGFIDFDTLYLYSMNDKTLKKIYTDNKKAMSKDTGIFDFMWSE